jgi:predicted PurR-regulated permease PerM
MDKTVIKTIKVVLTVVVMALVLIVLYRLAPVFAILFMALFVVLSVEPAIKFFMKQTLLNKPVSRGLAVGLTYAGLVFSIFVILTVGLPPVLGQMQKFLQSMISFINNSRLVGEYGLNPDRFTPQLTKISDTLLDKTASAFSGFAAFATILILSVYISSDWKNIKERFFSFFNGRTKTAVTDTVNEIEEQLGHWVKGELTLMLYVGFLSFFALLILGIDYPLALGLLAGLLEIIPMIGPTITWFIAGIVGFSISPAKGILALILFYLIQQTENSFLVPKVMSKVSGFSPLIVLLAILIAGTFFGAIGAIIAVPLTMVLSIILRKALDNVSL